MPLPIHHLKHLHHRVRHFLSRHRHSGESATPESGQMLDRTRLAGALAKRASMTCRMGVLVVSAALILMPFALSPVSVNPATAGQTLLLLAAVVVLYMLLAVRELINRNERHESISGVLVERISGFGSLFLLMLLIVTSANPTVALLSPQASVLLVLLFFLAAKKLLDREENTFRRIKKSWLVGLLISGLFYLVFASPFAVALMKTAGGQPVFAPALVTASRLISPQFNPVRPDWQTSLKVASETLVHSPFIGVGLGKYNSAFSAYHGEAFNVSPLWNYKYPTSFSTLFNWVTEGGVLGLIIYLLLFFPAFNLVFTFVRPIFNFKFLIFNQYLRHKYSIIKHSNIRNLNLTRLAIALAKRVKNFELKIINFRIIIGVLALASLFFPFSLAGYFYLITGYLLLESRAKS